MKELGIIFSAPMVRAILADRKSVTRRIVKGSPEFHRRARLLDYVSDSVARRCHAVFGDSLPDDPVPLRVRCPYGFVDRLWVREQFALSVRDPEAFELDVKNPSDWDGAAYCATYDGSGEWERYEEDGTRSKIAPPWRSPRFMPRWASRIDLDVIDVRVERLHEITEEDALAEGVARTDAGAFVIDGVDFATARAARDAFEFGWDRLHERTGGWKANPWVWRIEFARVKGEPTS
ncbi:MAG: hypothetical protein KF894_34115 [Labilithrix sp.]|nr:hypothetical protein [Labilithrix sp.]